jgi:hypothetical protein
MTNAIISALSGVPASLTLKGHCQWPRWHCQLMQGRGLEPDIWSGITE